MRKVAAAHGRVLMRVLVVYCHPVPDSFCAAVRDAAMAAIRAKGGEVRLIDLYAERFDPVMPAEERRTYNDGAPADPALEPHIEQLQWAEAILFVYPTWWYGLPAMLKGWFDRVWAKDVAFALAGRRQDHAADDAYQARSASSPPAVRRAGGRGSSASPAARPSCAASARFAPGAAGRCSWRIT